MGLYTDFKAWLGRPFDPTMNALHWFLFFGLLICISAAWGIILSHMKRLAE